MCGDETNKFGLAMAALADVLSRYLQRLTDSA
jgi:hypothetical protein